METRGFFFDVPERLIAQSPPAVRGTCRVMLLDRQTGALRHHSMAELPDLLPEDALLVFNDSRVRKARLDAESETGGRVEFLLIDQAAPMLWRVLVSKAKRQKIGRRYTLPDSVEAVVRGEEGPYKLVEFSRVMDEAYLELHGHVPLPPYIRRADTAADAKRYQTVFARVSGSAAAPTAGLHFTPEILDSLGKRGIEAGWVTLHVGLGTFLPIRTESIEEHRMHEEHYEVPEETARMVNRARSEGRTVIAVGTTAVRTLESAGAGGSVVPGRGSTNLFIYPGYEFRIVSGLFTNFHTPGSSLIVMVSAFAGVDAIRRAYDVAIEEEYRFFSYGDAMYIGPLGQ